MAEQVDVKHKETEAVGQVPILSLPRWEKKGWEAVDAKQVEAARERAGIKLDGQAPAEEVEVPADGTLSDPIAGDVPADDVADGAPSTDESPEAPTGDDGTAADSADTPSPDDTLSGRAGRRRS